MLSLYAAPFVKPQLNCQSGQTIERFYQPLDPYITRAIGMDCAMFNDSSHDDFQFPDVQERLDAAHEVLQLFNMCFLGEYKSLLGPHRCPHCP